MEKIQRVLSPAGINLQIHHEHVHAPTPFEVTRLFQSYVSSRTSLTGADQRRSERPARVCVHEVDWHERPTPYRGRLARRPAVRSATAGVMVPVPSAARALIVPKG